MLSDAKSVEGMNILWEVEANIFDTPAKLWSKLSKNEEKKLLNRNSFASHKSPTAKVRSLQIADRGEKKSAEIICIITQ
jgi:hypothetical protein